MQLPMKFSRLCTGLSGQALPLRANCWLGASSLGLDVFPSTVLLAISFWAHSRLDIPQVKFSPYDPDHPSRSQLQRSSLSFYQVSLSCLGPSQDQLQLLTDPSSKQTDRRTAE